jgi:hypothetical protein
LARWEPKRELDVRRGWLNGSHHGLSWSRRWLNGSRHGCENIPTWISLSGDLVAFSHQDGIYGFKFPKRFSELSQAKTSLYSLYLLY